MISNKNKSRVRIFSDTVLAIHALFFFMWWGLIVMKPTLTVMAGQVNPVVVNTQILSVQYKPEGAYINVEFYKRRGCDFEFLFWKDKYGFDHEVDFLLNREPHSRDIGGQRTKKWLIEGLKDITGSTATVKHNCYGFWSTYTPFYPSINMEIEDLDRQLPPLTPEILDGLEHGYNGYGGNP